LVMGSPLRSPPAAPWTDGRRGSGTPPVPCRPGPQPHPRRPRARDDLVKRPAPVAHPAPRRAGPGAEALAEVQRTDRPPQAAQRRLLAHQHPAHRPFRQHQRGTGAACRLGWHPPAGKKGHGIGRAHAPWVAGGSGASARRACLAWPQVGGLGALSSRLDVELDRLTVLQGR
jgi:hypothetical protein